MLTRWYDVERELAALDEMSRRMPGLFGTAEVRRI